MRVVQRPHGATVAVKLGRWERCPLAGSGPAGLAAVAGACGLLYIPLMCIWPNNTLQKHHAGCFGINLQAPQMAQTCPPANAFLSACLDPHLTPMTQVRQGRRPQRGGFWVLG